MMQTEKQADADRQIRTFVLVSESGCGLLPSPFVIGHPES